MIFFQLGSIEAYTESLPQYFILTAMAISHQAFVSCNVPSILGSPPQVHVFNHYVSNQHNETCSFTHGIRNASGNFEPIMCGAEQPLEDVAFYKIWNTTHQAFFFFEVPMYHYFRFNYYCTLISCTFGIVKFLITLILF